MKHDWALPHQEKRTLVLGFAILLMAVGCALAVITDLPLKYLAGAFLAAWAVFLFFQKTHVFLMLLFLFRASADRFLQDVRIADIGMGGLVCVFIIGGTVLLIAANGLDWVRLHRKIVLLMLLFCVDSAFTLLTAAYDYPKMDVLFEIIRRTSYLAVLALMLVMVRDEEDARLYLRAMVLSAGLAVLVSAVLPPPPEFAGGGRLVGAFTHPNILAFYLFMMIGAAFLRLDGVPEKRGFSLWRLAYIAVLMAALILTQTRSAWAACAFMLGFYALFFNRKMIIPLIVAAALLSTTPIVKSRIDNIMGRTYSGASTDRYNSLKWRLEKWSELVRIGQRRPVLGYGIDASNYLGTDSRDAHNDYVRFFVEQGILGVAAYFGIYFYVIAHAMRNLRPSGVLRQIGIFLICFLPAYLLMSLSENLVRYVTVHWYMWSIVGIYFALDRADRRKAVHA